jgi:alpha-galactosidase
MLAVVSFLPCVVGLDNGIRVPPMGWSSWYGFTNHINESLFRETGNGMISSGLFDAGYSHIWISDGWAVGRDKNGHVLEDRKQFPSGIGNLSAYLRGRGLKVGIYTSKGPLTCLGYSKTQPDRPGSCGFEQIDADVYTHEWGMDAIFDDGCGQCPQHDPWIAMRDALNNTGKPVWYAIHDSTAAGSPNATIANMWRTGPDLSISSFDMWTNRLDLATTPSQYALAGPGAFRDPDKLEVGYSPRAVKGRPSTMTALEQRSMFTMFAALPAPLILSADLRDGFGGIDGPALATLTNREVIAINQDPAALPLQLISNCTAHGLQVWRKPLQSQLSAENSTGAGAGTIDAVVFFHRGSNTTGPMPNPPTLQEIEVKWPELGYSAGSKITVRDIWANVTVGTFTASFSANVTVREAKIYTFTNGI